MGNGTIFPRRSRASIIVIESLSIIVITLICLESEDETDVARSVPSIQMLGLREFGVSPHQDFAESSLTAKRDGLVQEDVGQLLGGAVAAASLKTANAGSWHLGPKLSVTACDGTTSSTRPALL
jgi:hypothetical protein